MANWYSSIVFHVNIANFKMNYSSKKKTQNNSLANFLFLDGCMEAFFSNLMFKQSESLNKLRIIQERAILSDF